MIVMTCPNTRIVKTGTTAAVKGFSFLTKTAAVLNGIQIAKAVAELEASSWLATKDSSCPETCKKSTYIIKRARALTTTRRGWVFFGWGGFIIPIPLILFGWHEDVVADWEAHFECKDADALEENITVVNE